MPARSSHPAAAAAVVVAVLLSGACSDERRGAAGEGAADRSDDAGEAAEVDSTGLERLTAVFSDDTGRRERLEVNRCNALVEGTLLFSGTSEDGLTVHIVAEGQNRSAMVGGRTGELTELDVETDDGRFSAAGETDPDPASGEGSGGFTLSGRCSR